MHQQSLEHGPSAIFAALGDPTRLSIVAALSDGQERSIAALSLNAEITRQAFSKHLQVLEDAGIVASTRSGRENRYSLQPGEIEAAQSYLEQVSAHWANALTPLKRHVELKNAPGTIP